MTSSISSDKPEPTSKRRLQDDRRIVTPYAFGVADHLLGTPLASPYKRAIAIGIDMVLVALLTYVHSAVLAAATAALLVHVGRKMQRRSRYPRLRKLLIGLGGLIAFIILLGVLKTNDLIQSPSEQTAELVNSTNQIRQAGLTLAAMAKAGQISSDIESGRCASPLQCWQDFADELMNKTMPNGESTQKAAVTDAIVEYAAGTLAPHEQQELRDYITSHYLKLPVTPAAQKSTTDEVKDSGTTGALPDDELGIDNLKPDLVIPLNTGTKTSSSSDGTPSILGWVKGIMSDLGLGFGWAAFYFTVFGAWWNGQSPGKKLIGIRIVKLDASPMNLWESFGRYGGYGAGLATGLLGFLQLFWDSNRQAIQDKIAETLVIDLRKRQGNTEPKTSEPGDL